MLRSFLSVQGQGLLMGGQESGRDRERVLGYPNRAGHATKSVETRHLHPKSQLDLDQFLRRQDHRRQKLFVYRRATKGIQRKPRISFYSAKGVGSVVSFFSEDIFLGFAENFKWLTFREILDHQGEWVLLWNEDGSSIPARSRGRV